MNRQLSITLYKMRKSLFFYLAALGLMIAGGLMAFNQIVTLGLEISGQSAFLGALSDTSLFFVPSLIVSYFIGNDFTNRTVNNEIGIGYTRLSVVLSRVLIALPFAAFLYMFYAAPYSIIMGIANGFGGYFSITDVLVRFLLFFMQLISILGFSALIIFWCKKAAMGMMISVCFTVATCNVLRNLVSGNTIFRLTPFHRITMNNEYLTTNALVISVVSATLAIFMVLLVTHIVFRKAELK